MYCTEKEVKRTTIVEFAKSIDPDVLSLNSRYNIAWSNHFWNFADINLVVYFMGKQDKVQSFFYIYP